MRGGVYNCLEFNIRAGVRSQADPRTADKYIGVRCVQAATP